MPLSEAGWVFVSPGPIYEPMPREIKTKTRSFTAIKDLCRLKVDEIEFLRPGSIPEKEACRIKDERVW